jgi:PKD repeat protein
MRKAMIILFLSICYFTHAVPIWDDIKIEEVNTEWKQNNDFLRSNVYASKYGFLRDYGDVVLWKYRYYGVIIDKNNGNAIRIINQENTNSDILPEYGMWDLSISDTAKIVAMEFGNYTNDTNFIITKKSNKFDTLMHWVNTRDFTYHDNNSKNNFYSLSDSTFLAQIFLADISRRDKIWFQRRELINTNQKSVADVKNLNLNSMITNNNDNTFIFSNDNITYQEARTYDKADTHNFYLNNENGFQQTGEIYIDESSWFKEIINDSICVTMYKDTVVLYNFNIHERYAIHPTQGNENPLGVYWNEDRNTIDIAFEAIGDSTKIMSIHYPSKNLIKNENVVAPYLGRFVMNTGDGYTLSVGHGGYLYKHDLSVFETDSLKSDFSFKNTANYELLFSDESFGAIIDWRWDFGDGNTSSERHPIHKFASAGNYDVELIVTDEYGNKDTIIKQVKVTQKLNASFDFSEFSGQAPFTVQFKNNSSDNAVRYIWNFGDGTYSYEMEPAHTYNIPGEYSVSLTAFDENEKYSIFVQPKKVIVSE